MTILILLGSKELLFQSRLMTDERCQVAWQVTAHATVTIPSTVHRYKEENNSIKKSKSIILKITCKKNYQNPNMLPAKHHPKSAKSRWVWKVVRTQSSCVVFGLARDRAGRPNCLQKHAVNHGRGLARLINATTGPSSCTDGAHAKCDRARPILHLH